MKATSGTSGARRRGGVGLLSGAVGLSALGDFLALVPLALLLERETGSGYAVAGLFVALWSPAIVLAGPAGLLVDRADPRRVLVASSLVQAVLAVALAFADGTGAILGLAALLGAANAISQPAEFALLPRVAGEDEIARANGRLEAARYAGFTFGPLLAALATAAGGREVALLADAATFAAVAAAGLLLATRPARPGGEEQGAGRARDGIAFLRRDAVLRSVLPVAIAALLIMTAVATAEVFYAKDVLHAGDLGYGALLTAWTLGMVLGATVLASRVPPAATVTAAFVAIAVQGLGIALPAAWAVLAFALASFALGGVAHGAKNVLIRTLIHRRTPEHLHGRAFAAYGALRNTAELSALAAGGILVTAAGPRLTMAIAGTLPALLAVAALARTRRALSPRGRPAPRPAAAPRPTPAPPAAPAPPAPPPAPAASPSPAPAPAAALAASAPPAAAAPAAAAAPPAGPP
jgi:MFS family permease